MDVKLPDGTIINNVPDGMSKADLTAKLASNGYDTTKLMQAPVAATPAPNPTDGNSFGQNLLEGVGAGIHSMGQGISQRYLEAVNTLDQLMPGHDVRSKIEGALGINSPQQMVDSQQAAVDETKHIDAPLMATGGGKVGNFAAKAIPAVASGFVPGGQGLAGTILSGAALGAAEPTTEDESVLSNAALGGAGGAAGYGLAKGIGKLLSAPAASAPIDALADSAREAGYVLPPAQTNNSLMNNIMEGLSGKLQMRQQAAVRNQSVTNSLAAKALGLPEDAPITVDSLNAIRKAAGNAYQEVKQVGTFGVDQEYDNALSSIASKYSNAANDFPSLAKDDIPAVINSFKPAGNSFDSGAAIDAISVAREMADSAYASGNKALGSVYKSASKALEDLVDRNLQTYESSFPGHGFGGLLDDFRGARQLIAKTYSVQKGLNVATGDVNAASLGAQLQKGAPLTGELAQIANANKAFPFATKAVTGTSHPGVSALDLIAGTTGSVASGSVLPMLLGPGRMAVRSMMLSKPYQAAFGSATSGVSGAINSVLSPVGALASKLAPVTGNIGSAIVLRQRQAENLAKLKAYEDRVRAQKISAIGNAQTVDQAIQAAQDAVN